MAASKMAGRMEVEVRSALCVIMPPELVGDLEWYVRTGRGGGRRRVQPGDHVDPGCPLVTTFAENFTASSELADVVVLSRPSEETLARRRVEQERLLPRLAAETTWVCTNCGERGEATVTIPLPVNAAEVAGTLAEHEGDPAASERVRFYAYLLQREHVEAVAAERAAFNAFRVAHTLCDPERAKGLPEPPEYDPALPPRVWSGPMALGRSVR